MDQEVIERKTYSLLEWLGDCGGLFDALRIIGMLIMWPFTSFKIKSLLLSKVFIFTKSKRMADKQQSADQVPKEASNFITGDESLKANMKWDFENATKIPALGCLQILFGCNKKKKYRRMLERADSEVTRELDLVKYIERSRLHSFKALISLSSHQ